MQTKSHLDLVARDGSGQTRVLSVLANVLVLTDAGEYLEEREDRHIGNRPVFRRKLDLVDWLLGFELLRIRELPDE